MDTKKDRIERSGPLESAVGNRAGVARCPAPFGARAIPVRKGPADGSNGQARHKADVLRAIGTDAAVGFNVSLETIYRETASYLARLGRSVAEGRAIDEANNFTRWLQFSGVLDLLERQAVINENFTKLRGQAEDVRRLCVPSLKGQALQVSPSQSTVDQINSKVDYVLSLLAKAAKIPSENPPPQLVDVSASTSHTT